MKDVRSASLRLRLLLHAYWYAVPRSGASAPKVSVVEGQVVLIMWTTEKGSAEYMAKEGVEVAREGMDIVIDGGMECVAMGVAAGMAEGVE